MSELRGCGERRVSTRLRGIEVVNSLQSQNRRSCSFFLSCIGGPAEASSRGSTKKKAENAPPAFLLLAPRFGLFCAVAQFLTLGCLDFSFKYRQRVAKPSKSSSILYRSVVQNSPHHGDAKDRRQYSVGSAVAALEKNEKHPFTHAEDWHSSPLQNSNLNCTRTCIPEASEQRKRKSQRTSHAALNKTQQNVQHTHGAHSALTTQTYGNSSHDP